MARKMGKPQQLAVWFWTDTLGKTDPPFTNPTFWRYVKESKILLERGYELEAVKRTIKGIQSEGVAIETLFAIEWLRGKLSCYELYSDPMMTAPPVYETIEFQKWNKENIETISRGGNGDLSSNTNGLEVQREIENTTGVD